MALTLHPKELPLHQTSWYHKTEATFSDALATVRQHLWNSFQFGTSSPNADMQLIPSALLQTLQQIACYSG
jgi:hypothetical protein